MRSSLNTTARNPPRPKSPPMTASSVAPATATLTGREAARGATSVDMSSLLSNDRGDASGRRGLQLAGDLVAPRRDVGPVAVIAGDGPRRRRQLVQQHADDPADVLGIEGAVEDPVVARRHGKLRDRLRQENLADVTTLLVGRLSPRRSAAEEPQRPRAKRRGLSLHEVDRFLHPCAVVDGAPDDERIIGTKLVDLARLHEVDVEPVLPQRLGDALRDTGGRAVLALVRDEHFHGIPLRARAHPAAIHLMPLPCASRCRGGSGVSTYPRWGLE